MTPSNLNRVVLTANLTKDPVLRSTPGGTSVQPPGGLQHAPKDTTSGEWVDKPTALRARLVEKTNEVELGRQARGGLTKGSRLEKSFKSDAASFRSSSFATRCPRATARLLGGVAVA